MKNAIKKIIKEELEKELSEISYSEFEDPSDNEDFHKKIEIGKRLSSKLVSMPDLTKKYGDIKASTHSRKADADKAIIQILKNKFLDAESIEYVLDTIHKLYNDN
jgi:hypothetical protein